MRVLTVGNMYPPHHRGGYELVWATAVAHLQDRGHDVRVLTTTHREPGAVLSEDDHALRELRWYWNDDAWPRLSAWERLALERHNRRRLLDLIGDFHPDVVCWWAMGGMSLSMIETVSRLNIPEAFVVCDDWLLYGPHVDGWLRAMRRLRAGGRLAEAVTRIPSTVGRTRRGPALYPSRWLRDRARAAGWRFTADEVVGQGVPRALFKPATPRQWRWRIACVGRLDERKGVDLAIGALAQLPPEAHLSIIGAEGTPAYRDTLLRMVEELGVGHRVDFSSLARSDLGSAYADADVVAFPVRWPEPWGLVPLEAMSVGVPVVATGRGGSGEYLRDQKNCLIFDPDDGAESLADAIRTLAGDAGLRSRLREGGLATAERYGESDFDRAVEELLVRASAGPIHSG